MPFADVSLGNLSRDLGHETCFLKGLYSLKYYYSLFSKGSSRFVTMEKTVVFCLFYQAFVICGSSPRNVQHFRVAEDRYIVLNDRPIVGIAVQETPVGTVQGDTFIPASYIKYLEQAGARVVPVLAGEPDEYYNNLFGKINGLLFPGGGVSLTKSQYARIGRISYNFTLQAAKSGEWFPLWGTCLGFQLLTTITADALILNRTDSDNLTLPLDLVSDYRNSRMLKNVPPDVLQYIQNEPVTQNEHEWSLLKSVFDNNEVLSKFFKPLSTNQDRKGLRFISTAEAYHYPVYGTQWHPEKNAFNWNPAFVINHDAHAVQVAQYFADFFVNEARKSTHRFPSAIAEAEALIDNYNAVYTADGTFNEIYFFNMTKLLPL